MTSWAFRRLLKISPPPFATTALDGSKPAAQWIKHGNHAKPHQINARQAQAITGWPSCRKRPEQPRRVANREPGEQDRQRVDQKQMHDIIEEWHAAEGGDHIGHAAADAVKGGQ